MVNRILGSHEVKQRYRNFRILAGGRNHSDTAFKICLNAASRISDTVRSRYGCENFPILPFAVYLLPELRVLYTAVGVKRYLISLFGIYSG